MKVKQIILTIAALTVLGVCLLPVVSPVFGLPIQDYRDYFGAFTGPRAGIAQDDNIKASMDLAHTDLDSILTLVASATIETQVTDGLESDFLSYFLRDSDGDTSDIVHAANDSILAKLLSKDGTPDANDYNNTTDSLEAIADHVQTLITTGAGTGTAPTGISNESILAFVLAKGETATASTFNNTTDSLEAISDALAAGTGATAAIEADHLDHLAAVSVADEIVNESFLADITSSTQDWSSFVASTDSLQAIRDRIDTLNTADQVDLDWLRVEMAEIDANLITIDNFLDTEIAAILADTGTDGVAVTTVATMEIAAEVVTAMDANSTSFATTERSISKTLTSLATTNNLFAVTGGPIKIVEIVTYVTVQMETKETLVSYNIDPTNPGTDTVVGSTGTALDVTGDAIGTLWMWDGVLANNLIPVTNGVAVAMGTDVSYGLIVPIGMIELASSATNTGDVVVSMRYQPLSPDSVVTAQ